MSAMATGLPCTEYDLCEIQQLEGPDRDLCLSTRDYPGDGSAPPGYCYVDDGNDLAGLLGSCPTGQPRKLQFVGTNTPLSGSLSFIVCPGREPTEM